MGRPTSNWQPQRELMSLMLGLWWAMVWSHLTGVLRTSQGIRSHLPFSSRANTRCARRTPASTSVWEEAGCGTSSRLRWEMG